MPVNPIPLEQSAAQPFIFKARYPAGPHHGEIFWVYISTDNIRTYTSCSDIHYEFRGWLSPVYTITGGQQRLQDPDPEPCLGPLVV